MFVLNCKKRKIAAETCSAASNETTTLFKLSTTIRLEDDISTHLQHISKSDAEQLVQKTRKPIDVTAKAREAFVAKTHTNRFKVINYHRAASSTVETDEPITIVDVVKEDEASVIATEPSAVSADPLPNVASVVDKEFVYDLYVIDGGERDQVDMDNFVSIRPFDDLVYRLNDDTLNDTDNGTDDSNDENNWRNDYPDTDDDFSIGEDDMRRAVEDLNVGSDSDLSSDESDYGPEPVVHFVDENDSDEYNYFKKHGRIQSHSGYYRKARVNRSTRPKPDSDSPNESDSSGTDDD